MSSALAICHGRFGRATLYRLDRPILTHAHREGHLIFFLDGAPATILVDGEPHRTSRGEAVAIDPFAPHAHRPAAPGAAGLFLVLYVRPGWFAEASRATGALRFGASRIEVAGAVGRCVERVARLLGEAAGDGRLEGALLELAWSCFERSWAAADAAPRPLPRPTDFRVRRAMRLLGERLGRELPLDRVAREAGLSRPHFYALFKSQLGLTPSLYLDVLRVESALERLVASPRSVTEIGHELGFACQSSFTRFFTARVGLPPSDYRRRARLLDAREFQTRGYGRAGAGAR